jgi:serine/threonine-protein kinase RsbW
MTISVRSGRDSGPPYAGAAPSARTFPGSALQAAVARRWARAEVAGMAGPDVADLAELGVSELFTNAVTHSRSGRPGGTITVIITCGADGVTVHVRDQGAAGGVVPRPRDAGDEAESGRGLLIVKAVSSAFGTGPAAMCQCAAAVDRPPVPESGFCVWFCPAAQWPEAGRRPPR